MNTDYDNSIEDIVKRYDDILSGVENEAKNQKKRAYGGLLRSKKGNLVEHIAHSLVLIAWKELGGNDHDIEINSNKIKIPINKSYVNKIDNAEIRKQIQDNIEDYHYKLSVDKHVFIKNKLIMGIECKAYAENAMIKRILIDFDLLKLVHPDMTCFLFQLESQLGGDYSKQQDVIYGSNSTHTIMSYFNSTLTIITLLEGERKVNLPIHNFFKPLHSSQLNATKEMFKNVFNNHL